MNISFNKYSNSIHSEDAKNVARNFAYLTILQVVGYIFPLVTIPYLAKVIGVEGFGKVAFAFSVIVWIQTIVEWGFNYTATRDVAKCREDSEQVSRIFSNVLWAKFFLMIITLIVLIVLIAIVPKFRDHAAVIMATFFMIPGMILFPEWFFQAIERMKYITILNVLEKTIFTVLVLLVVKHKEDYVLQPLFVSAGYMCSGIIATYIIVKKWNVKILKPNLVEISHSIKKSTDVFINTLAPNLYSNMSVILLGFFGGSGANGLLEAGTKIPQVCSKFIEVISRAFFPYLSRKVSGHGFYAAVTLSVAFLASSLLVILSNWLIDVFYTSEFHDAIIVFKIFSLSVFFVAITQVYGTNYLIVTGKERLLRNITITMSIFGFAIAVPLIYYYGYVGAGITISLSRILIGIAVMFFALKVKKVQMS